MTPVEATLIVGGLSNTSKMPCKSYSIPAQMCHMGSKLVNVKGSVCHGCYALKGMYSFKNVKNALNRRAMALDNPKWVEAMTLLLSKMPFFRWHDSGDLQSVKHLGMIVSVCFATPKCKHWLPTREYGFVKEYLSKYRFPPNLCVRLSGLMIDGKAPYAFAESLGVQVSEVADSKLVATCPAPKTDNKCKDCRMCWNKSVFNVRYNYH